MTYRSPPTPRRDLSGLAIAWRSHLLESCRDIAAAALVGQALRAASLALPRAVAWGGGGAVHERQRSVETHWKLDALPLGYWIGGSRGGRFRLFLEWAPYILCGSIEETLQTCWVSLRHWNGSCGIPEGVSRQARVPSLDGIVLSVLEDDKSYISCSVRYLG